jgi:hypothetical protein
MVAAGVARHGFFLAALALLVLPPCVLGAWGAIGRVRNDCSETITVTFDRYSTATLSPGQSTEYWVCERLCAGGIFSCKDNYWSVSAAGTFDSNLGWSEVRSPCEARFKSVQLRVILPIELYL